MREIHLSVDSLQCQKPVVIGVAGEYGVTRVIFDYSAWAKTLGSGTFSLRVQRPGETEVYAPAVTPGEGSTSVWEISDVDTGVEGMGYAQCIYRPAGGFGKSLTFAFAVAHSLNTAGEPPDPYEDWLARMEEIAQETDESAEAAADSAEASATSATAAETAKTGAEAARDAAQQSAGAASDSATAAALSATAAEAARAAALTAKSGAEEARDASVTAKENAEAARDAAAQSAGAAADSATAAADAETAAQAARDAAQQSATAAETAEQRTEATAAAAIQQINTAGATQVQSVNTEGAAQVQAVEDKGEEVLASIPPDYSALVSDVEDIETELDGVATEATAQQTLVAEDDGAFWLGRALMVMDGLADDLIARVEAEIAKLPQDENGQAIAESIGEGNSWLNMLYHELEVN